MDESVLEAGGLAAQHRLDFGELEVAAVTDLDGGRKLVCFHPFVEGAEGDVQAVRETGGLDEPQAAGVWFVSRGKGRRDHGVTTPRRE